VAGLRRSVGFRAPDARLSCVVGRLHPAVRIVEVHGFKSFDERDLPGFAGGTENPEARAAEAAVLIGDEDPGFAGGSYLIVQKYLHDLAGWNALTVEQQEAAIGRTKLEDVEFPDSDKAPDSHLTLNVIDGPDGDELQIMRFNMPFGRAGSGEFGTYYVAYAATPAVTEEMLDNMFLGKGEASHDRLLDFSTARTGNLYFVPDADFLDDPPVGGGTASAAEDAPDGAAAAAGEDGSLGIGGMR
jgi:putative iron-dependent peroxidase